ncbi:MAG: hypothetical protein ACW964_03020 [Candidatus Hodarchaeales archaeon]|jgi:Leucine-rich repeat (LRR) protein
METQMAESFELENLKNLLQQISDDIQIDDILDRRRTVYVIDFFKKLDLRELHIKELGKEIGLFRNLDRLDLRTNEICVGIS